MKICNKSFNTLMTVFMKTKIYFKSTVIKIYEKACHSNNIF